MSAQRHSSRRWLAALLVLAAGCGEVSETPPAKTDSGVSNDGGPLGGLTVTVEPEVARPAQTVRLTASYPDLVKSYRWSVLDPLGQQVAVTVDGSDGKGRVATYQASAIGTYVVHGEALLPSGATVATNPDPTPRVEDPTLPERHYLMRITPPEALGCASRDVVITTRGADQQGQWDLDDGAKRTLQVTWGGAALDTTLRLYASAEDPAPREVLLAKGKGEAVLPQHFHAVLLPAGKLAAGVVLANQSLTGFPSTLPLGAGTEVKGTLQLSGGKLLAGAVVSLHAVEPASRLRAPSTLATTDAAGAFTLIARADAGKGALTVAAPPALGLPLAVVDGIPALPPQPGGGWSFTYLPVATATVSGSISRAQGGAARQGAMVVLTRDDTTQVGALSIGGGAPLAAVGRYSYALVSDGGGVLRDPASGATSLTLPAGTYVTDVWPGDGEDQGEGHRRVTSVLGAGAQALTLSLARRVSLSGKVAPLAGKGLVQTLVRASAQGGGSFVASTDPATGAFAMSVDDETTYSLSARAIGPSAARQGTFLLSQVEVKGDLSLETLQLPPALVISGRVVRASGSIVAGALVRIWCADPGCASREIVDEAQTLSDGSFALRVPVQR